MIEVLIHPAMGIPVLMLAVAAVLGTMMVTELGELTPRWPRRLAASCGVLTLLAVALVVLRFVVMSS